jgi:hypothetical protein
MVFNLATVKANTLSRAQLEAQTTAAMQPTLVQIEKLLTAKIAAKPNYSQAKSYWTNYHNDGSISYGLPKTDSLIFDTETFVTAGNYPIIGTAASNQGLHLWMHPSFFGAPYENMLIDYPEHSLMVAHSAAFDFAKISNRYKLDNGVKAICTMAMGKSLYAVDSSKESLLRIPDGWSAQARVAAHLKKYCCALNLIDLYNFVCGESLSKETKKTRNIFVDATDFQEFIDNKDQLLAYAMNDVLLTLELFQNLYPKFIKAQGTNIVLNGLIESSDSLAPVQDEYDGWLNENQARYDQVGKKIYLLLLPYMIQLHDEMQQHLTSIDTLDCRRANPAGYRKKAPAPGYPIAYRWFKDFLSTEAGYGCHWLAYALQLKYLGKSLARDVKNGWYTEIDQQRVPKPDGSSDNLGFILVGSVIPYVECGDLTSELLPKEKLIELLELLDSSTLWTGYSDRFKQLVIK